LHNFCRRLFVRLKELFTLQNWRLSRARAYRRAHTRRYALMIFVERSVNPSLTNAPMNLAAFSCSPKHRDSYRRTCIIRMIKFSMRNFDERDYRSRFLCITRCAFHPSIADAKVFHMRHTVNIIIIAWIYFCNLVIFDTT